MKVNKVRRERTGPRPKMVRRRFRSWRFGYRCWSAVSALCSLEDSVSEDMHRRGHRGGQKARLSRSLRVVGRTRSGGPVYSGVGSIRRRRSLLSLGTLVVRLRESRLGSGGCSCGGRGVARNRQRGGEEIVFRSLRNRRKSTLFPGLTAARANPGAPVKGSLGAGSFPQLGGIRGRRGSG